MKIGRVKLTSVLSMLNTSRCLIPTCESSRDAAYDAAFLNYTTPYYSHEERWESCLYYDSEWNNSSFLIMSRNELTTASTISANCTEEEFSTEVVIDCDSGYVFSEEIFSSSVVIDVR